MKKLFATLTATLTLTFALNANAKIGDTFVDPEFGTITVKAPSFENDKGVPRKIVNGQYVLIDTPQKVFLDKTSQASINFGKIVDKLNPNMTNNEIIIATKGFITNFQNLKALREVIYIKGYNPEILLQYRATIKDGQRAIKYKFWDYLMKIKGTPEFNQLREEINFSSKILDSLELYR